MNYHQEILEKVKRSGTLLEFKNPVFLDELDQLAQNSLEQSDPASAISAALIYQQLVEKIIVNLIDYSTYFTQLQVWPLEFHPRRYEKLTFGQLIIELEHCTIFELVKTIISKSKELNKIRIKLVHELTEHSNFDTIKILCIRAASLYHEIYDEYEVASDEYRLLLKHHVRQPEELEDILDREYSEH